VGGERLLDEGYPDAAGASGERLLDEEYPDAGLGGGGGEDLRESSLLLSLIISMEGDLSLFNPLSPSLL
jgi:hypothetical protein